MKSNIKLDLTDEERRLLRKHKIKKSELLEYAYDELAVLLNVSEGRARELYALADFQRIPSIGIEFARDLIFLGYYNIQELRSKDGAKLLDDYEYQKGFFTDPCVEDQFRLAVDFAKNQDYTKRWWDFTKERKAYRSKIGYPKLRPTVKWTEV